MNKYLIAKGFALPTVLIASVVMMLVLLSGLTSLTSTRAAQLKSYETRIAREASESGNVLAKACIAKDGSAMWSNSKPLKPNTDCSGNETVSCPATDADARSANANCFILAKDSYRTSFEIGLNKDANGTARSYVSKGVIRSLRASSGLTYSINSVDSKTFNPGPTGYVDIAYTGNQQIWTVPSGVNAITIECWGAAGGAAGSGTGGLGGYAKGVLSVTPGQTLNVFVGGVGGVYTSGGYNGGGNGSDGGGNSTYAGAKGGGASDVRSGGTALSNRIIVAGGGGGGYYNGLNQNAGVGGGTTGGTGSVADSNSNSTYYGVGGAGGTQTAGGSSGGALGQGGAAATNGNYNGGGGGGFYGGGGGSIYSASGGGGSSYIGGVTTGVTASGQQSGNGKVRISW